MQRNLFDHCKVHERTRAVPWVEWISDVHDLMLMLLISAEIFLVLSSAVELVLASLQFSQVDATDGAQSVRESWISVEKVMKWKVFKELCFLWWLVSSFSSQINTAKHPLSLLSLSFCTEEFFWKILKVEKLEMNIGISFMYQWIFYLTVEFSRYRCNFWVQNLRVGVRCYWNATFQNQSYYSQLP